MNGSSSAPKIVGTVIAIVALVAIGFAARLVIDPSTAQELYTRIDNSAVARDGSEYEYTLPAYDAGGSEHETTFKASKMLREDAYLKLDVMPIRGIVNWEEVQIEDVPEPARGKLEDAE